MAFSDPRSTQSHRSMSEEGDKATAEKTNRADANMDTIVDIESTDAIVDIESANQGWIH